MLGAAGDIAFVGYNADGGDNLAFVTFKAISTGEVIYFSDNEWNGTAWADLNEATWSWTANANIAPGAVITIDNIGSGTATSNLGTVTIPLPGAGSNRGLAASDEMVYAYLGTALAPTVFLAAITNDAAGSGGSLANTGLTYGVNAINLATADIDADIAAYNGARSGLASLAAYLPLINNAANWITQDASGDQNADGIAPDAPFPALAFTAAGGLPSLSVNNVTVAEGDTGQTLLTFTLSLNAASADTVSVDFATADNTATTAGADYVAASGTLTFAAGETVKTVSVAINGDTTVEASETLRLNLSNPTNATIATGQGTGTIANDDFTLVAIHDIQGAGLVSPLAGQAVTTSGIVTAVDSNGFYLQAPDAEADADLMTSEAIFVFTSSVPSVAVGDAVRVTGQVAEFTPGGAATGNLSTTELVSITALTKLSSGNPLPAATVMGAGGRLVPTESIAEGIAFYESMEAMRVTVPDPLVVAGTSDNGEIWTVADRGVNATNLSDRGTLVSKGSFGEGLAVTNAGAGSDYNPERIQIDADPQITPGGTPIVNPGAVLASVTGVLGYNFGNYEVIPTSAISVATTSTLLTETTALSASADRMTIAQYNVLNLDPGDSAARFQLIAQQITVNLQAPDIIALQEIQDNSGPANNGVVSASVTLQMLVDAIAAQGGPTYSWIDNPFVVNNAVGGEPGGNIRVAYLYNDARVDLVAGSVQTTPDAATAFANSRVPLVATFAFSGDQFTLVNNHFSSKGGSTPLFGATQPSLNGSADARLVQAQNVADYVSSLGADANVVVLGDLNEFTNEESLAPLVAAGLSPMSLSLDPLERYSYMFEGNAQELDQTYVSRNLLARAEFDIVHANAEFATSGARASDHDPSVLALSATARDHAIVGGVRLFMAAQSLQGQTPTPVASDDLAMVRLGSITGAIAGAESVAFENGKVYATNVNGNAINVHAVTAQGALVNEAPIALSGLPGYKTGGVNGVAVRNGVIAVAYENANAGQPGFVALFDAVSSALIKTVEVGVLPDQLTFTADGNRLLVANEAEALSVSDNPAGSVSVIDLSAGAAAASVVNTIAFDMLDGAESALAYQGLALYPGQLASADIEPEYITVSPDGTRAYVTLQEVNAVAVIDLTDPAADRPLAILPLGTIDRSLAGNAFDGSDRDSATNGAAINLRTADVLGLPQPDAIASFAVAGVTYFVTANEGDSRVGTGISDSVRLSDAGYVLDPVAYPNAAVLKGNGPDGLGRLNVLTHVGDTDGDGDYDQIYTLGGRGISIFRQEADGSITKVRETGGEFEAIIAANYPALFNSNQSLSAGSFDTRSDDKGPEPEGVTVGVIDGRTYAFVGLERVGGFMVYDVTDPENARFVTYRPETAQDLGPEVQAFVSAANSPTGQALLLSGNEISNSVTLYSLQSQNENANVLIGGGDADTFRAKGGDDTVEGRGGNDTIDGGEGTDVAVYAGAWVGYAVTNGGATVADIDPANGNDGTDTLIGVELLRFAGVSVNAAAAVNDAPLGVDDANTGPALVEDGGSTASGNALANDTDADLALGLGETIAVTRARAGTETAGGTLTALAGSLEIDGIYGKLTIATDGAWNYALDQSRTATQALNSGQTATEAFTYEVKDAHGLTDLAQITLAISGESELVTGGPGKDSLTGSQYGDLIKGFDGPDSLTGLGGDDVLDGGAGKDTMAGGTGNDTYFVDNPNEVIVELANEGTDLVLASVQFTLPDHVENAMLTGSDDLKLSGNALANILTGNDGANRIEGQDGDDTLFGGAGADKLFGGLGMDVLTGGSGADSFHFEAVTESAVGAGRDMVLDFEMGVDKIVLQQIDANVTRNGNQAFSFIGAAGFGHVAGELRVFAEAGLTIVAGDTDGDGVANFEIGFAGAPVLVAGAPVLVASEFVL